MAYGQPCRDVGRFEVICGPMFSGKSEELMRRLRRAAIAKQTVITFKPSLDKRYSAQDVVSHCGTRHTAFSIDDISRVMSLVKESNATVIGIDEVQFFPQEIVTIICTLIRNGKRVLVAGLDLDFRGMPFGPMPILMAIADEVVKLSAICTECGKDAHCTQRLVDNRAAHFDDPIILIGAQDSYQARCRGCYEIDKQPVW